MQTYPPRDVHVRQRDFHQLPNEIDHLYREVVEAFLAKAYRPCVCGIRSILEMICNDRKVSYWEERPDGPPREIRSLQARLENLLAHYSPALSKELADLKHLADEAIHKGEIPDASALRVGLKQLEHLFVAVYGISDEDRMPG